MSAQPGRRHSSCQDGENGNGRACPRPDGTSSLVLRGLVLAHHGSSGCCFQSQSLLQDAKEMKRTLRILKT